MRQRHRQQHEYPEQPPHILLNHWLSSAALLERLAHLQENGSLLPVATETDLHVRQQSGDSSPLDPLPRGDARRGHLGEPPRIRAARRCVAAGNWIEVSGDEATVGLGPGVRERVVSAGDDDVPRAATVASSAGAVPGRSGGNWVGVGVVIGEGGGPGLVRAAWPASLGPTRPLRRRPSPANHSRRSATRQASRPQKGTDGSGTRSVLCRSKAGAARWSGAQVRP